MKIHLVQANFHIGNFSAIRKKCIAEIELAKTNKANIVVFPEMAATGYPALDLLTYPEFVSQAEGLILDLAELSHDIAILIGGPETNKAAFGKQLFNSAYFLAEGRVKHIARKMLLPTYDIFDEYRYFQPSDSPSLISYKGQNIFISICEDLWNEDTHNLYGKGPLDLLLEKGQKIDLHLNIAASPFDPDQTSKRAKVLLKNAKKGNCPVVYCNHTGTQTELVFDGDCQVMYPSGESYNFPLFQEHSETIEIGESNPLIQPNKLIAIKHGALVAGVKDYFGKLGFTKALLGLSGGIDSALTAQIAKEALGAENVLGVLMPSQFSSDHSVNDAIKLAKILGIQTEIIPIKNTYDTIRSAMPASFQESEFGLAEENMQARARGLKLMALSNKWGHVLLNTSNKSEIAVGYGTLYGDMCGGLSVIGDLYKTEVFEMCRWLNTEAETIPWNTINKPPSAELRPDQKDSDSLPDYAILDHILQQYIEEKKGPKEIIAQGFEATVVAKTIALVNRNEFKRFQSAPILRISKKAFGFGRRIPLVASPLTP